MHRFFFHLVSSEGFQRDEEGSDFADIESAYLDAREAALEIAFSMLRDQRDPYNFQFEIVDDQGRFLMELPFSEVLRPNVRQCGLSSGWEAINKSIARNRQLRADIGEEFARTRTVIHQAQSTLRRSRALSTDRG